MRLGGVTVIAISLTLMTTTQAAWHPGWPPWYANELQEMARDGMPTNTIDIPHYPDPEIPPSKVELLIKNHSDESATRNVPQPERTIDLGIRNLSVTNLGAWEVMGNVFPFGFLCCETPKGKVEKRIIPPILRWRGFPPKPDPIPLGERFWYPCFECYRKSIQDWFGPMNEEGLYLIWWEYRDKKSNVLIFRREGPALDYIP